MSELHCLGAEESTAKKTFDVIKEAAPAAIAVVEKATGDKKDDKKDDKGGGGGGGGVRGGEMSLTTYALYGAGALAVGGLAYYFLKKKRR